MLKIIDLESFINEIKNKIETTKSTLATYQYKSDNHSVYITSILKEEISTLQWVINLTEQYKTVQI